MKTIQKEIIIGVLVAIFATIAGVILYLEVFSDYGYTKTFQLIEEGGMYGEILTLGAVPNLFVFFIFLKKKQDLRAKGVLLATIVIAFVTLFLKFL